MCVIDHDLVEEVVLCVNCVQLPDTAELLSGILWKAATAGGRSRGDRA